MFLIVRQDKFYMETKLNRNEAVAVRVYTRRRRKAYDHFYFLQDLKIGDIIFDTELKEPMRVVRIDESYDASPLDIVVFTERVNGLSAIYSYGFSIKAYEAQFMSPFLKYYNKTKLNDFEIMRDSTKLTKSTTIDILYGK